MTEHTTPMTEELLNKIVIKEEETVKKILGDEEKLNKLLQGLEKNIDSIPGIGPIAADIPVLVSMIRSYAKGEYTEAPLGTIVSIVAGIVYLVSPDFIPGFVDDAAVLAFVVKKADDDLDLYREWQKANGKR